MAKKTLEVDFQWHVEPYATLTELRDRYLDAVFVGTTNSAQQMAKEAQEWMKSNAPWQDRPSNPATGFIGGRARAGLKVRVIKNEVEEQVYKERMAEAINKDAQLRDEMEAARKERKNLAKIEATLLKEGRESKKGKKIVEIDGQRYLRIRTYPAVPPNPRAASRLRYNIRTQRQYKRVRSVPKGRSAVAALEKSWKGEKSPLVDINFSHNRSLGYPLWLEIANEGKYAIISRAIAYWSPKFMAKVKQIANLVQYQGKIQLGETTTQRQMFEQHVEAMNAFEGNYKPWDSSPEAKVVRVKNQKRYERESGKRKKAREAKKAYDEALKTGGVRRTSEENPMNRYEFFDPRTTRR